MFTIDDIIKIREEIAGLQTKKRFEHTLGVAYTAACMAFLNDTDPLKAEYAGLLHDCAKCFSDDELTELCKESGIALTDEELASPAVIHAKYGRFMASERFGVEDEDVLNAISYHTTGRPEMSKLEKIIFAADFIEPLRDKASNLKEARMLAFSDLDACVLSILESTVSYLNERGAVIVPDTLRAYEYYRNYKLFLSEGIQI